MMKVIEDKYGGVTVAKTVLPETVSEFKTQIAQLLVASNSKELMWVKVPIQKSTFIPVLADCGFEFHHCDRGDLMLVKTLQQDALIPATKNFIAGVGAVVFHQGKVLAVRDRFFSGYKIPGGHIEPGESIKDAVKREVMEETGVIIEFESIMNIGHFRNGQFGESNLYMVCTAKALTVEIAINDSSEILEARWIDIEEFLTVTEVNNYNRSVVRAAYNNAGLKLTHQAIKLRVDGAEVFY